MPHQPDVFQDVSDAERRRLAGVSSRPDPGALDVVVVGVDTTHALVRASGELSLATIARLTDVLQCQLRQGRRHVRLDLSGVTPAGDGCLRELTFLHGQFLDSHGLLTVCGVGSGLATILATTELDRVLFVTDAAVHEQPAARRGVVDED